MITKSTLTMVCLLVTIHVSRSYYIWTKEDVRDEHWLDIVSINSTQADAQQFMFYTAPLIHSADDTVSWMTNLFAERQLVLNTGNSYKSRQ